MKRTVFIAFASLALSSSPAIAAPGQWPKLDKGNDNAQCREALKIAKAQFESDAFYLYAPPTIPDDLGSTLVLKPSAIDLSGGDALEADPAVFDKIPNAIENSTPRSIYWQRDSNSIVRLVIGEQAVGWRGDMYSLFPIKKEITAQQFLVKYNQDSNDPEFASIVTDTWRPPLIFKEVPSGDIWVIDVGAPYVFMSSWWVYSMRADGVKHICRVDFRPPKMILAQSLLPKPIRTLAALLDSTLGSGQNEGTLNPTARLRLEVQHTWANVALRPWALTTEPYNTRKEADAGLMEWSHTGPSYRQAYREIQEQYPVAQRSLAQYYQMTYKLSPKGSQQMASWALDFALRSHYSFHSEDRNSYFRDSNTQPNPWEAIRSGHSK